MSIGYRECREKFESSNLSRDNVSREIGRTAFRVTCVSRAEVYYLRVVCHQPIIIHVMHIILSSDQ